MIAEPLIIIALCVIFYGAFSSLLSRTVFSAPMLFTFAGLATGAGGLGLIDIQVENATLEGFGELTLGLILFADAASTNSRILLKRSALPLRLLLISLPLTIGFGALVAIGLFPTMNWRECALVAAILAPTDAALGLAVTASKQAPERIRQAILVESGFNDGLALPAVLLFAALAFSMKVGGGAGAADWISFALRQIVVGVFVGGAIGYAFGRFIGLADVNGWIAHGFGNLSTIGVAVLTLFGAHIAGGNGFIAAFAGGLVFGGVCMSRAGALTDFVEEEGQLFSLIIFFFFGAVLLPRAAEQVTPACIVYALLSLTIIRMAPTWISLSGTGLKAPSRAFIGWFGPRGLASILFLMVAVEHEENARLSQAEAIVYVTVFLSIILHGASAAPFTRAYAKTRAAKEEINESAGA
ncbi:MAG: cation:proton antiporter [Parvularculaceae bacterium]|nr:cation:proton antiporter [Parvularculaceae bacterium]